VHYRILIAALASLIVLGPAAAEASLWGESLAWIATQQRNFHLELSAALKALKADGGTAAAWSLVLASFLYGVFHAAGPGHGKVVLTTYLLTQGTRVRRGIVMATAAAFLQGVVAVVLVYGLIYLAGWLPRDTSGAVSWAERLSYALVAGIGLVLAVRALGSGWALIAGPHRAGAACAHDHDHGPTPEQLDRARDLRTVAAVVFSIGLRPCSGAILVLVFAKALGMAWAGVGAVAAISAGTAIAVACLALLATNARNWAASAVSHSGGAGWQLGAHGVALVGGGILVAVGGSLLANSFAAVHPLGL